MRELFVFGSVLQGRFAWHPPYQGERNPCSVKSVLAWRSIALLLAVTAWAEEPKGANLPLKRVVLFSSGVGFFENSGKVEDDAKVEMKFKVDQINDLLKSMVVQDLDGGQVSTVNYGSKDPITKTLKSFAIDLTANPTMAQLLEQVRGEKVEVEAPNKITGVILGVETHKKQVGENQFIEIDVLNLLTDEGLRSVPMDTVSPAQAGQREARRRTAKGPGPAWPPATPRTRKRWKSPSSARASAACAWATSRRRRSGKPPIAWCSPTRSRSSKAGRSWKTPPRKIGRT